MNSEHRPDCTFGPGFYRIVLEDGGRRFCRNEREVRTVVAMLGKAVQHVQRDACLDEPDDRGVVDGERFLSLPKDEAMRLVGIEAEADYVRAYHAIEGAVLARDRAVANGVRQQSVVIKKRGVTVSNV